MFVRSLTVRREFIYEQGTSWLLRHNPWVDSLGVESRRASEASSVVLPRPAQWCARTTVDVMAAGVGIAVLPVTGPAVLLGRSLSGPARFFVDKMVEGAAKTSALAVGRHEADLS